jgi:hypothetical protein
MNNRIAAVPGQWYLDRESGDIVQIVSVDEDDGSIDMQHTDGSLEETSMDDWVGPFDDLEADDIGLPEAHAEPPGAEIPMERALLEIEERRAAAMNDLDE